MFLRSSASLLAIGLAACGQTLAHDAGHDAGADAGWDAGRDAGPRRDAGWDAGRDGGPTDPVWEPWVTVGDGDCTIERARHPERLVTPVWEPCEWQPEGCLVAALGTGYGLPPAWFDGTRGWFTGNEWYEREDRIVTSIHRTDGPVLAAYRAPPGTPLVERNRTCIVRVGIGEGYASLAITYTDFDDPSRHVDHIFHAPIESIGAADEPIAIISPGVHAQGFYVSPDLVAMWTGPRMHVVTADGRFRRNVDRALPGIPQAMQVVGRHMLWQDWADLVRIGHATFETEATLFHRADPADIKLFYADGVEMAWLQGYDRQPDGQYARLELWAAPYVRDPAELRPRLVRTLNSYTPATYGGGWYAITRPDLTPERLQVVRTADGTLREWIPPDGWGVLYDPLYVSDHEIMIQTRRLVRIDPHTLPVVAE